MMFVLCVHHQKTKTYPFTKLVMSSLFNFIKYLFVLAVCLMCCQIQAKPTNNDESELHDLDFVRQFLSNEQEQPDHQQYRRASLRYHPHILYKKASLKPLIGHNGKMIFGDRERY
ncbi:unnamed protein product [Adineta ricciae]|uniref:Uncharacterized protein n=2 Tax=Adineta ricciae TaxID=249248 RepID=A0A815ES07_ADIRI|nr:unnamed protein product [Adineta ricciae]